MPKRFVMHEPGKVYDNEQKATLSAYEIRDLLNERDQEIGRLVSAPDGKRRVETVRECVAAIEGAPQSWIEDEYGPVERGNFKDLLLGLIGESDPSR